MKDSRIVLLGLLAALLLVAAEFAWGAPSTGAGLSSTATAPAAKGKDATAPAATKAAKPATPTPAPATKPEIEMPPEPPPMSKTPPDGVVDLGENGKITYKDGPTPIVSVFMLYRQSQVELKYQADKEKAVRSKLDEIQRTQALARKELSNQENPFRMEMAKLRNQEKDKRKELAADQPRKPVPVPMPPAPARQNTSSYSGSSGSSNNNNDNAYYQWQARCQQIQQQNAQNEKKYQQDMAEYKKKQAQAKTELADLVAKVKDLDAKIDALDKEFDTQQVDTVAAAKSINDGLQSIARQTSVITTRQEALAAALRGAPENVRLASGIVEWEGSFYAISELKTLCDTTQAEINKVRDQLKEDAAKAGRTFAADWRHPQQDRMDALKALLDKAKAAQAAGAPAKAAKPAA